MKLSKTICVTPGTVSTVYQLEPTDDAVALCRRIMQDMRPEGAEAFLTGGTCSHLKNQKCFENAASNGMTRFTCRVPSSGNCGSARLTVDFTDRTFRVTCGGDAMDSAMNLFRETGRQVRIPRTRRVAAHAYA